MAQSAVANIAAQNRRARHDYFIESTLEAGIMLAGDGLHPTSKGKRVRFDGASRTVIDGPFAETKELIAGYWLWNVASMEEAIAYAEREDLAYRVFTDRPKRDIKPKSYADNFRFDRVS